VHNLRPAREVCESCHTPTSFTDNIIKTIKSYANDEKNTPLQTTLILKMGGVNALTGESMGIHWHISSEMYYIALDEQRQVIAWVGVKQPDGSMKEYFSRDLIGMRFTSYVQDAGKKGGVRRLDCIDCHNRAAHYIPYPEQAVDLAIANELISTDLPYIRSKAVNLLNSDFASQTEAFAAIEQLRQDYEPAQKEATAQAIETLKDLYTTANFPDMNLDWRTNPNNARHMPTAGCFRCHDGNHVAAGGTTAVEDVISVKCNLCHTVPIVGRGSELIIESPVIVGDIPESHSDFRWTIEHRNVENAEEQGCFDCHGRSFCNNGACHSLSHPVDMAFSHAEEFRNVGGQVCYTCHQNVTCTRCHPAGIIENP
jgi:hypothetical protein